MQSLANATCLLFSREKLITLIVSPRHLTCIVGRGFLQQRYATFNVQLLPGKSVVEDEIHGSHFAAKRECRLYDERQPSNRRH